jgi:Tfp pilus assembly protein PilZ
MATGDFRRRYDRKHYVTDIVFSIKDRSYSGTLKDISLGGAFVSTRSVRQAKQGDEVTVVIPFTNGRKNVKRKAKILWANEEGFAIEFS